MNKLSLQLQLIQKIKVNYLKAALIQKNLRQNLRISEISNQ
jgi:hypothetical protein